MTDIAELFSRQRPDYTDDEFRALIDHLRQQRHLFNAGVKLPKATKKRTEKLADKLDLKGIDL